MKKDNTNVKFSMIASGAVILGAFGASDASAANPFSYEDLGTGSELRSHLLTADALNAFTSNTDIEFECGEGKCGEGKCGNKSEKKEEKKEGKAEMKEVKSEKAESSQKSETGEQKSEAKGEAKPAARPAKKKAAKPAAAPK